MTIDIGEAGPGDVEALSRLRTRAAEKLTERYGKGHWSSPISEAAVKRGFAHARVLVARERGSILGTLRLATKKPWAIDVRYFTPVKRAIYLTDMAVAPEHQGRGVGRRLLERAATVVGAWPGQAIRLDAYDAEAGAGGFYASCGYRPVGRVTYRGVPLIYFERVL